MGTAAHFSLCSGLRFWAAVLSPPSLTSRLYWAITWNCEQKRHPLSLKSEYFAIVTETEAKVEPKPNCLLCVQNCQVQLLQVEDLCTLLLMWWGEGRAWNSDNEMFTKHMGVLSCDFSVFSVFLCSFFPNQKALNKLFWLDFRFRHVLILIMVESH